MQHVAYYRVSTLQQGESGLGLAAQKDVVLRFIGNEPLLAEFTEIESGRRHKNRPQLLAALELCKKKKARLVIAKLDRLSRNVAFISSLMESGVDFVCCDNPHANRLMLHLLAAFAEHEREIISQRIKAAFGRIKADLALNGSRISKSGRVYTKLGSPNLEQARIKAASLKRALRPPEYALRLMSQMRDEGNVLRAIAAALNNMEIRTPQGFHWYASTVRSTIARIHEITKGRKDANTMGGNNEIAPSSKSRLPEVFCPDTSATRASNAQALFAGGDMSLEEAKRMIEVFTSVGARSFLLTKLDLMQQKIWAKSYTAVELRDTLPAIVRTAEVHKPVVISEGNVMLAGENVIIRPSGNATFVQLDDLKDEQLGRVCAVSFITIATSPGNYQAWLAVSGVSDDKETQKDLVRRIRRAVGDTDKSASGAVRLAGTTNYKLKYAPNFPTVTIEHAAPGRVVTEEQLSSLGLIAAPERVQAPRLPMATSSNNRPWPSYEICLQRAPRRKDGNPDRSRADFNWCLTAITGQKGVEETIAKLLEVSERARERLRSDPGYARVTVENAAKFVAQNYGKSRSRA